MAREDKKLTVIGIKKLDQPGRYNDGGGLYLLVKPGGGKYWLFRYRDRTTGPTCQRATQQLPLAFIYRKWAGLLEPLNDPRFAH